MPLSLLMRVQRGLARTQFLIAVIVFILFCLEACVKHYFMLSSVSPQAESEKVLVKKIEARRCKKHLCGLI